MKVFRFWVPVLCTFLLISGAGCSSKPAPLYEGVLFSVSWETPGGSTSGLTRGNLPQMVPGGSGTWNMDMYGKLYPTHLEIQFPQCPEVSPQIIPFSRLVSIQFGNGGIQKI